MDDVTILQARFIAFFEIVDLDPRGQLHYPDLFAALVERYNFQKFPQKYEEFNLEKGPIILEEGKWEGGHIIKVEIYSGGIVVDTRSSTDDSEKLLHDCLTWASTKFGIQYHEKMMKRKAYVSHLIFHSAAPIFFALSNPLSRLAENVTRAFEKAYGEKIDYQPSSFAIHLDQTTRQLSPAAFTVMRRAGIPFTENKYYSEAPLPTSVHQELLRGFEADLTH
jgi:hypothetical protein